MSRPVRPLSWAYGVATMAVTKETMLRTTPSDRRLNHRRYAATVRAQRIIETATTDLIAFEQRHSPRIRSRREADLRTLQVTIDAILSDLMHHHAIGGHGDLRVSRSKRMHEGGSRYRASISTKALPDILDRLASPELALIEQEIGTEGSFGGKGRQTTVRPGKPLKALMDEHEITANDFALSPTGETIVLKRTRAHYWDRGGRVGYEDDDTTRHFRAEMATINAWLQEADLDYDASELEGVVPAPPDLDDRRLERVFNLERFDRGGRLFGGFWQNMGAQRRLQSLFINGDHVVELDYGQMTPRILYGHVGAEPPAGDLYAIPPFDKTPAQRKGVKLVMNAMTFRPGELERMPKHGRDFIPKRHSIHEITDAIRVYHTPLAPLFGTGIGYWCQFVESEIMIDVLLTLKERGIVALPIHDAILVADHRAPEAHRVLKEVFEAHVGLSPVITSDSVLARPSVVLNGEHVDPSAPSIGADMAAVAAPKAITGHAGDRERPSLRLPEESASGPLAGL